MESQTYVEYEMRVIVKRPVRLDPGERLEDAVAWRCGFAETAAIEREVLRAVRVLDGDCEAQIVSAKRGEE